MKSIILRTAFLASILFTFQAYPQTTDTIFFEDWEAGIGSWWADNGVWEIGVPASGPGGAYSGQQCAATVLAGNYPSGANSRLISPYITLPGNLQPDEKITLQFWHWFSFAHHSWGQDIGLVQISVDGGSWQTVSNNFRRTSVIWSPFNIDLTAYANSTIRLGFRIIDESYSGVSTGWYIDNISISTSIINFNNPENWESGIGDWWATNGVWQVGDPGAGSGGAYIGSFCAATVLNGNYPVGANSVLVSPSITLSPLAGQSPGLFFWHWFSFATHSWGHDVGFVQISVNYDEWQNISNNYSGTSSVWTQVFIDLAEFADSTVRLGFRILDESYSGTSSGWYIDNIRIEGITTTGVIDPNTERSFNIFPNPISHAATITFDNPNHKEYILSVYNLSGEIVYQQNNITSSPIQFHRGNLSNGVYILELRGDSTFMSKLILM